MALRKIKRAAAAGGVAAAVVLASLGVAWMRPAEAASAATVTVDAGAVLGTLNNPAWYQNQAGSLPAADLTRVEQVGPPRVTRVWIKPDAYYDEATGAFDFSRVHAQLDQVAGHSDRLLANVDQCDQALMDLSAPQTCRAVLKAGLLHYKRRYPMLRYIEVFNEPDKTWIPGPSEKPAIPIDEYYQWYRIAYSVVNEVNAELRPDIPLAVGGPVTFRFNSVYLPAFLDRFAADQDQAKRLDFVAYHDYGRRDNPADVQTAKSTIQGWLAGRGLDPATPVVVSEYGVFPGGPDAPTGHGPNYAEDLLTQAAAMATLGTYYVRGGMDMPLHWVFNHPTNERKSMFVDGAPGAVHPYYNVVKMQRMFKANRIGAESDALSPAGIGVNALATRDSTGIAVLTTNYQWTTGTTAHATTVRVRNLPAEFTGMAVRVERYLLDATTSNYAHDPATADLQRVQQYVLPAASAVDVSYPLTRNAVSLLVLTPIVHAEAEDIPTAASSGDTNQDITDGAASGGRLNKLGANARGDYVRYTVPVPRAGRYRVLARMKKTPDRGIAQLTVAGADQGPPVDTYSTGYGFLEVDFGVRTFAAAGPTSFTFTMTGTSSTGYTLGVDYLELMPLSTVRYEVEQATPRTSDGDHMYYLTDAAAGGGGLVKLASDAVGDWLRFTVHVPRAGEYLLTAGVKTFANRGTCQFSVGGAGVGGPVDGYSATPAFLAHDVGTVVIDRPGATTIACQVVGRHPDSAGYEVALDHVQLTEAR